MNSLKNQQIEFDVFPKDSKDSYSYLSGMKNETSPGTAPISVVFSHQSIIIVFIGIILLLVASFTLGVEKGKLVAKNSIHDENAAEAGINISTAISPGFEPIQRVAPAPKTPVLAAAAPATIPSAKMNPESPKPETIQEKSGATSIAGDAGVTNIGGYAIQVATVKTQTSAKRLAESLAKKGWKSSTKPSGSYIIVLAGNFSKKEDAQSGVKELKKTYSDCFIKKI